MLLRGQASGVIQTMRQVGATVGLALMGTIVANVQSSQITDVIAQAMTVSIGVASIAAGREDRSKLMGAADAALYTAKQNGRNRVCKAPD